MGRFETLNADTQDLVNCLLPVLAADFGTNDPVNIIPVDIRMRAWDCERRDHIKDQTENDPRNWGVQFLKDLKAIARLNGGNLDEFQARLRAKTDKHEAKHPWCRLSDIREIKDEYEHPNRPEPQSDYESSASSIDSYLKELHEPELPKGSKGSRKRNHEVYEARLQLPRKRKSFYHLSYLSTNIMQRAVSAALRMGPSIVRRSIRTNVARFANQPSAALHDNVPLGSSLPTKTKLITRTLVSCVLVPVPHFQLCQVRSPALTLQML